MDRTNNTAFDPARLLRSRARAHVRAFGVEFTVLDLIERWRAVCVRTLPSDPTQGESLSAGSPGAGRGITDDAWRSVLILLLENHRDNPTGRVVKYSSKGSVTQFEIDLPDAGRMSVVCKQGTVLQLTQRIGTYLKGPKEWREFWMGHRLREIDVTTPLPLVCLWRRAGACHLEARIITQYVPNAVSLDQAVRQQAVAKENASRARASLMTLTQRMVDLLCALGRRGYCHRDLKASNILVAADGAEPWLIDLDGLRSERRPFGRGFEQSIARLSASLNEIGGISNALRLRALRTLLSGRGEDAAKWKPAWRQLQARAELLATKQRRKRQNSLSGYE